MTQNASHPRIVVPVSTGLHPVSGAPRWSRNDARALGLARSLVSSFADIHVVHAAAARTEALDDYLALGVRHIDVLDVAPGADIVPALADYARGADLIICGMRAEGQEDSGMVPYLLAQRLDMPLLPGALELGMEDGGAGIVQFLPKGRRRRIETRSPCVITAHPMAPLALKYAHANKRQGRLDTVRAGVEPGAASPWTTVPIQARPVRLAAREKRSGHARMLSATTTASRAGTVMDQGSTQEKAVAVLTYLRKHGLIDY